MNAYSVLFGIALIIFGGGLVFTGNSSQYINLTGFGQCLSIGSLMLGLVFLITGLGVPKWEKRK